MRYVFVLLTLMILGCKKENPEPKIEIYLLKNFVNSISENYASAAPGAGFIASPEDLQGKPFITDDEILAIDTNARKIVFDKLATKKILELEKSGFSGVQYAITIDGEITHCGYFWSRLSSYCCAWNAIYPPMSSETTENYVVEDNTYFDITNLKRDSPIFPDELVNAFRKTNRLVQ